MSSLHSRSYALLEEANEYLPEGHMGGGFSVIPEGQQPVVLTLPKEIAFVVASGRGSKIQDVDGNRYIDYMLGGGTLILGHAHPSVVQAVQRQAALGSIFLALSEPVIGLAEKIASAVPCAETVKFVESGAAACFYALRLSRAFTKKEKILKFEGGYHGYIDYAQMSYNASGMTEFPLAEPCSDGIPKAINDTVLIAPFNDIDFACSTIKKHHDELAAVIVEPFQRDIRPRPGFLSELRKVTSEFGVILIFDELVTGFRLAYGGAQEYYGVIPDLAALGKAVGGGYPIGVICGRKDIMALSNPSRRPLAPDGYCYLSGTLNGNPVSCSAGLAAVTELEKDKDAVYPKLAHFGDKLRNGIGELADKIGIPVKVLGDASMWNVHFTDKEVYDYRSSMKSDKERKVKFELELIKRGILPFFGARSYVSAAHTEEDIDKALEAAESALKVLV